MTGCRTLFVPAATLIALRGGRSAAVGRVLPTHDHHWEGLPGYQHRVALLETTLGLSAREAHCLGEREDHGSVVWHRAPVRKVGEQVVTNLPGRVRGDDAVLATALRVELVHKEGRWFWLVVLERIEAST